MKPLALTLLAASLLAAPACKSELDGKPDAKVEAKIPAPTPEVAPPAQEENSKAPALPPAPEGALTLDGSASAVAFVGAKVTGDHTGTFPEVSGHVTLDGETPTALAVQVSVSSLEVAPDMLRGHLLSKDFFEAETHPHAIFSSTSITAASEGEHTHTITGDLTLRGRTNLISFPATVTASATVLEGRAEFKINRKDWDIVYAGQADDLIKDDVLLKLQLAFPRA